MEGLHEALLMDVFVKPEVIPHNVTHAFLASIILIIVALVIRSSSGAKGCSEFYRGGNRSNVKFGRRKYRTPLGKNFISLNLHDIYVYPSL